jgi:hypothetical protein
MWVPSLLRVDLQIGAAEELRSDPWCVVVVFFGGQRLSRARHSCRRWRRRGRRLSTGASSAPLMARRASLPRYCDYPCAAAGICFEQDCWCCAYCVVVIGQQFARIFIADYVHSAAMSMNLGSDIFVCVCLYAKTSWSLITDTHSGRVCHFVFSRRECIWM